MKMFFYSILLLILGISDAAACIGAGGCTRSITINTTNIGLLMFVLSMILCLAYSAIMFYDCFKQKEIRGRCIVAGILGLFLFGCHLPVCWECGLLHSCLISGWEDSADIMRFLTIAAAVVLLFYLYLWVCFLKSLINFDREISGQKAVCLKHTIAMACFLYAEILIGAAIYIATDYNVKTICDYSDCM